MYLRIVPVILCLFDQAYSWSHHRRSGNFIDSSGCSFLKCKRGERCVNRKFSCKIQPCPNMLYCAKSPKESLKGPSSCESVKCSKGYSCIVKFRHCKWNEPCRDETARCISDQEYFDGPASCAGYKCPSGQACILRESFCPRPPCKLFKSCSSKQDVFMWMDRCKFLGCLSEQECYLRRPEENCPLPFCKHQPDCAAKTENELVENEKCRGWICPKDQKCITKIIGPCQNDNCPITRSCSGEKNSESRYLTDRPFIKSMHHEKNINTPQWGSSSLNPFVADVKSTLSPLTSWLNYLRAHTGAETVKLWIKNAENNHNIIGFRLWLKSVKDMLGVQAFDLWLDEVQAMTMNNKPFQHWLSATLTDIHHLNNSTISKSPNQENYSGNIDKHITKDERIFSHQTQSGNEFKNNNDEIFLPLPHGNWNLHEGRRGGNFLSTTQEELRMKQRQSFINLLEKLRDERYLYLNVINKTQELVSKVQPLLPVYHIDEILENLKKNISMNEILFDLGLSGSRRNSSPPEQHLAMEKRNSSLAERPDDYLDDDENEFVLVDYDDPLVHNQSAPRIYIQVEKTMDQPIKIGTVELKYADDYEDDNVHKKSSKFKTVSGDLFHDD